MVEIVLVFHYLPGISNYLYGNHISFQLSKKEESNRSYFVICFRVFYGFVLCECEEELDSN